MTNQFRSEEERRVNLTKSEQDHILGASSSFQSIISAGYFDNYDLPCPIRVEIRLKDGNTKTVVLRKTRHGKVETEVAMFDALKEYGLPVPEVLVSPFQNELGEFAAVYSLLPGENLQKLSMRSGEALEQAKELLIQAVTKLIHATDFISKHEVSKIIPRYTLTSALDSISSDNNAWKNEEIFQKAVNKLKPLVSGIHTPLVLSNGDYQPGNFLAQDGEITGFLDFESPSFQDPLMGFVKYPIYDLYPLARTDLIEVFLQRTGFSIKDFPSRLALGCLQILTKEIPVLGGDGEVEQYRNRVLNLLKQALNL
jgi:aminoglycoside phosphotransferase (APT) family kinase protein